MKNLECMFNNNTMQYILIGCPIIIIYNIRQRPYNLNKQHTVKRDTQSNRDTTMCREHKLC